MSPSFPDLGCRRDDAAKAGFTLLEVVVALAIAALALVALFRAGSDGLLAAHTAVRVDEAIERAQSHLAGFDRASPIVPSELTGDDGDGYRWQLRARPIARQSAAEPIDTGRPLNAGQNVSPRLILYEVEVTISWREGSYTRSVVLETSRIGTASAAD